MCCWMLDFEHYVALCGRKPLLSRSDLVLSRTLFCIVFLPSKSIVDEALVVP